VIARARRAAYEALRRVSTGSSDLAHAIVVHREPLDDERDRALMMTIVTGALRWQNRLDWLIARAVRRDLRKLDPEILDILRLGLFQLLFLTRVPAAAVVDDSVKLARVAGKSSASGLVNGTLRNLSRSRDKLDLPTRPTSDDDASRDRWLDALSITGSHPRWLVARWIERLGTAAAATWVDFNNREPALTIRANTRRVTRVALADALAREGVATTPLRFAPDGLSVESGNPLRTSFADAGDFIVQDESSQIVPLLAGVAPRARTLDACASPGGKTLILGAGVARDGLLVAADRRWRRVTLLRDRLAQCGLDRARIVTLDLEGGAPFGDVFDLVLLDAPCTGLGTIRRDVDIRWRREEPDLQRSAAVQRRLLREAAALVAPRGRLVYATCSSEPEENEQVAGVLAEPGSGFARVSRAALVAEGVPDVLLDAAGALNTRPDLHQLEAFFGAAFERIS
jgi:16S rRNA (cytosine967-C5)-methyltransferase